jgi:cytolysin (calcineurin-like family phosphatase)
MIFPANRSLSSRRRFLQQAAAGATLSAVALQYPAVMRGDELSAPDVAFFVLGDTHYRASDERPAEIDARSAAVCGGLVEMLNRLPGTEIPAEAGGGKVAAPAGVIHVGDVMDTGDKQGPTKLEMQKTELARFRDDFGLTGKDGRLKYPVFEMAGNHDAPHGEGRFIETIKQRNRARPGLANVSDNGIHYSWDWGGTHFVNLGLIVGTTEKVTRRRRYAALDSLAFLIDDLAQHVGDSGRPVVLAHHVDIARYTGACDADAKPDSKEWDPCDVRSFYDAIEKCNVSGVFYGHTHARNVFHWDGQSTKGADGIAVFNSDNASHFGGDAQAFFYVESRAGKLRVREFQTKDRWATGEWTPTVWTT